MLPELLMPAGDIEKAYYAFKYGADAIYCGCPMFSLRTRMNTFTEENMAEIVEYAHKHGKKVFVTLNAFPHQNMMEVYKKHLIFLENIKPDGLIIADAGVLEMANEFAPSIDKHLSVQASTVNTPAMKFWMKAGVKRVILAREIALEEVKKIHEALPELELEYFVHGAVCMAYSGRCLLSNFMAARDANRGACAHSCRWNYRVYDENGYEVVVDSLNSLKSLKSRENGESRESGICPPLIRGARGVLALGKQYFKIFDASVQDAKKTIKPDTEAIGLNIHQLESKQYWEEELRSGQIIPVEEDFHGTHIMSSRDMCMIEFLQDIIDAGVCSLKVEGRNKTIYYLSTVARAYRKALDNIAEGKPFDPKLWEEIHATANRGFFAGFLKGKPHIEGQQYEANVSLSNYDFVGQVLEWKDGRVRFEVKNRIDEGESVEFMLPKMDDDFCVNAQHLEKNGESVVVLHGGNGDGWMDCNHRVEIGTLMRKKVNTKCL